MRYYTLLLIVYILGCNNAAEKNDPVRANMPKGSADFTVATTFINDYTRYLNGHFNGEADTTQLDWIMQHPLLTTHFKNSYKRMVDSATKADPEMGLDFDPLLDAQDFPDNGYTIASKDTASHYVTMTAKDFSGFQITMKLVSENNKWLVEGCGVINIPEDKRAGR